MIMEKRVDIGLKVVYAIGFAVVSILLGFFFNGTRETSLKACEMGYENTKEIAVLKNEYKNIDLRLSSMDIKLDKLLTKQ